MQKAEVLMEISHERGKKGLPLERLYRHLFNPELYLRAYGKIYRNDGAMTPGSTAETAELDVHLICDNLATHKTDLINDWLAEHPRFHMHFTPTGSSWCNQVERWFGRLTDQMLRRGVHKSVAALRNDIQNWIDNWNNDPKPFTWNKPPKRSSTPSPNIFNEFLARDTSVALCAVRAAPARSRSPQRDAAELFWCVESFDELVAAVRAG